MHMFNRLCLSLALVGVAACAKSTPAEAPAPVSAPAPTATAPQAVSPKSQVRALLESIESGDPKPAGVINPGQYTQHNLGVADGLAGFGALLAQLPEGSAKVNPVRVFQDGDFVFAHT